MKDLKFETRAIVDSASRPDGFRGMRFPVYSGVAFDFESAEDINAAFEGKKPAHSYSRLSNPTVEAFERKITDLENAYATIALSSGMAAITNLLFTIMQSGDNILVSKYLFGNTYSLLKDTFPGYGLETRFIDILDETAVEAAIDQNTRALILETISNPQMIVPDIKRIAEITRKHGILLIVDATVVSPWLFDPKDFGADVAVHSTTKFISGGATSVGGVIVDLGVFDWKRLPALKDYHHLGENALIARLKKEIFRNFGACMAPQTAFLQNLGLETLALRVNQSCHNTHIIAQQLNGHPKVAGVYYPGLEHSPFHDISKKQFKGKFGGILGFELKDRPTCFHFMNNLKLIHRATNLNDNNTLIIHPASTIFCDFSEAQKRELKVSEGLLRLSVGIEHMDDILDDLLNALECI